MKFYKYLLIISGSFILTHLSYSQHITAQYEGVEISLTKLQSEFGTNKILPKGYEVQALLALSHYPELKDIKIKFKLKRRGSPIVSQTSFWGLFQR